MLIAVVGVGCQTPYIIITDEIKESCDCFRFAVSITYKNGGNITNILTGKNNGYFADGSGCLVTYVDLEDTFRSSSNLVTIGDACLPIANNRIYSTVFNYEEDANSLVSFYSNIDTTGLRVDPCINKSEISSTVSSGPAISPSPSASGPDISPGPSASGPDISPNPPANASSGPAESPSPTVDTVSPGPAANASSGSDNSVSPNGAWKLKPFLTWIVLLFFVVFSVAGSSHAEIVVAQLQGQCPTSNGVPEGSTPEEYATVTAQADAASAAFAQASEVAGGDGYLAAETSLLDI